MFRQWLIVLLTSFISLTGFAQSLKLNEIKKIFEEKSLDKYVTSGQTVIQFFDETFIKVSDPNVFDGGFAAEYFDLEYQVHLRPNVAEPYLSLNQLTTDTNNLLKLHRKYFSRIKNKVFIRNYFQTAFIGLLHTIESIKKVQVGLPQDGYNVLTNLIIEYSRLVSGDQKSFVTMTDFWWDYMWAYFTQYPVDIIEIGNQKLRGVWLSEKKEDYKKRIEKFLASLSMLGLRKATPPLVYRDISNQLFVRLAKNAYEIYGLREDTKALSKARIFKYKYESKSGLTEDAERTKKEIAREGLVSRFKKLFNEPSQSLASQKSGFIIKNIYYFLNFLYGVYYFIRYLIGFLLITFPFDAAFILAGMIILSIEGRVQFEKEFISKKRTSFSKILILRTLQKFYWKTKTLIARIVNDFAFSIQMLIHSYTQDSTTRNVRIGSSLLIFGLGLFFSSARTMVESFVAQMSI